MTVKFTRKEVLKYFKWRTRRKIKKQEKLKAKDPLYKKAWDGFIDGCNHHLAFGISYAEDRKGNDDIDHIALLWRGK